MIGHTATIGKDFFDTNTLVYAYDRHDPAKRTRALNLMADAMASEKGVVSAQVLSEFFNTVTRRIPNPLTGQEAQEVVTQIAILPVVEIDSYLVQRAIGTCIRYQRSYWDALIVAAAERAACARILSEDLNPGQSYNGIPVVNPF